MKFSAKKYFVVLFLIVVITCCTIPLACYADSAKADTEIVIQLPEIEQEIDDTTTNQVPTFKNGYTLWNYAINKLDNGKGADIEFIYSGTGGLAGISYTQLCYTRLYYDDGKYFEVQNNTSDSEFGQTTCMRTYYDKNTTRILWTPDVSNVNTNNLSSMTPNYEGRNPEVFNTVEEYNTAKGRDFKAIPFVVNKSTAMINYFKSDKNYYYVEYFIYANKIPQAYLDLMQRILTADKICYDGVLLTCVMSKKTGNFVKMTRYEEGYFTASRGILTADIPTTLTTNYNFYKVDSDVQIPQNLISLFDK